VKNLLAYAYLMMNFDAGAHSPLQVLERVVIRSLINAPERQSLSQIRSTIEADWGFTVPLKVVRYTMGKLAAQERVRWEYDESSLQDTYTVRMSDAERTRVKKDEQAAREKYERFRKKVAATIFREGFQDKFNSEEVIEAWLDKSALSFLGGGETGHAPVADDFTYNRIIAKTLGVSGAEDEEAISDLTDLALGDALYRSVKEITEYELDDADDKTLPAYTAWSVQVFIDVGIVARALGYHGEDQRTAADEMFKMARDVGYIICIFDHTLDEFGEIIASAAARLHSPSTMAQKVLSKHAVKMGISASEMLSRSKAVEQECSRAGIKLIPAPPHDVPLTLDESELEHRIRIGVQQENPRARQRDIDSLTSIFRLRDGEPRTTLDSCTAIFITHNRTLQDVAHKFFRDHFDQERQKNIVQLCMTDNVFSSRLWTKLPTKMNLRPRNQVIAFALTNLAPAKGVRESFLQKLHELVSRERINPETAAFVELSDFTNDLLALEYRFGDSFDQSEAELVVQRVIAKARADLRTAQSVGFDEGLRRSEEKYKTILDEKKKSEEQFNEATELEIAALRDEISTKKAELEASRGLATLLARWIVISLLFLVFVGAVLGGLVAAGLIAGSLLPVSISTLAGAFLTWLTWGGLSGIALFATLQNAIEAKLMQWAEKSRGDSSAKDPHRLQTNEQDQDAEASQEA